MRGLSLILHALWIVFATAKFTEPVSSNEDFYQIWSVGDTIDIKWDAGWAWGGGEQPSVVDLFITWYDTPKKFSQLIAANISLDTNGNYSWQVNVPNDKIAQEPKFVFRFSQHTNPEVFNFDLPKMPSRGFILLRKEGEEVASTTTTSVSSQTTTSVSSQTSTAGLGANSSPAAKETDADDKPKAAIIAACVLAVLLGIALILGVALFFLRRARRRREDEEKSRNIDSKRDGDSVHMYVYPTQELAAPPQELIGDGTGQSRELNGSTPRDWH